VEIVRGPQTTGRDYRPEPKLYVLDIARSLLSSTHIYRDFIVNRLNCALAREATYIVGKGWSSIEDVDKALCNNAGLKLAFEGPLELQDYIGWDISVLAGKVIAPLLCNNDDVTLAESMVSQGRLGLKSGRGVKDYSNVDRLEVQDRRNRKILRVYRTVESFRD
jgi:3-hydroxyacyl-CoA dehydrogenase